MIGASLRPQASTLGIIEESRFNWMIACLEGEMHALTDWEVEFLRRTKAFYQENGYLSTEKWKEKLEDVYKSVMNRPSWKVKT